MLVLLTGEGPTDIGTATDCRLKAPGEWILGPVSLLIREFIADALKIENLHADRDFWFAPKPYLSMIARAIRPQVLNSMLPACSLEEKKRTRTFLAVALYLAEKQHKEVLPILFRDCDNAIHGRNKCDRLREDIQNSSKFIISPHQFVCPLIARPSSEVWFTCALCHNYDINKCTNLEMTSSRSSKGNHFQKDALRACIGEYNAHTLCNLIRNKDIRALDIKMPSIKYFYEDLKQTKVKHDEISCIPTGFKRNTSRTIDAF